MTYSSVADIVGVIKRLNLEDENYGSLISDLSPFYGSLNVSDIEANVEELLKYSKSKKIESILDRSFLTLDEEERENIKTSFESLPDKDIQVPRLMFFKFNKAITELKDKIQFCIDNEVDYKNDEDVVFEELFFLSLEEIKQIASTRFVVDNPINNYESMLDRRNGQR